MPLKISDTGKAGVATLNQWADERERQEAVHSRKLQELENKILELQKKVK
jgi:hypothetical protein